MAKGKALIIRHGALGDCIQSTAVIPYVQRDYAEIDYLCSPHTAPILEHNPRLNRIMKYTRDSVPLDQLHSYYKLLSQDYDMTFVLTQTVESRLVFAYPQEQYYYPLAKRRKLCSDKNYIEEQIRACGYEPEGNPKAEIYFGKEDILAAKQLRHRLKKHFLILWPQVGSSINKGYLHFGRVADMVLDTIPEAIILTAGEFGEAFKLSLVDDRIINLGLMNLAPMTTFAVSKIVDLVIGPDSAVLNASGCFDVAKICMLNHSSKTNITKHWTNDFSIQAQCYCSPCHYLHKYTYIWQNVCPLDKYSFAKYGKAIPACTAEGFPPRLVFDRIMEVYETRKDRR